LYIDVGNRKIIVHVKHCGVDINFLTRMIETDKFKKKYERMKELTKGKLVIGSTDKLSPLSGIPEKLAGYRRCLEHYNPKSKLMLIQVILEYILVSNKSFCC